MSAKLDIFQTHLPSPFVDVIYGWSLSSFICEASKNTFTSRLLHHGSLTSKVDLASDSSLSYILWQRRNHPRRFGRKIHLKTGHVHAIQDITVYLGHQHICIYLRTQEIISSSGRNTKVRPVVEINSDQKSLMFSEAAEGPKIWGPQIIHCLILLLFSLLYLQNLDGDMDPLSPHFRIP